MEKSVESRDVEVVRLQCVSERGGKLRVRIVTPGYALQANCRFPRAIRVEGKEWEVPASAIKLMGKTTFYYTVSTKDIKEVQPGKQQVDISDLKVYDVTENDECVICSDSKAQEEMAIIAPCGHKCGCFECMPKCKTCPICRGPVMRLVRPSELE